MNSLTVQLPSQLPAELQALVNSSTALTSMGSDLGGANIARVKLMARFMQLTKGDQAITEWKPYMDFLFLGASKHVERNYYKDVYRPGVTMKAPDCFSRDGVSPDPRTIETRPRDAYGQPVTACATCPMNQKGSGTGESRACAMFKRAAVVPVEDPFGDVYAMRIAATSLFGKGEGVHMTFSDLASYVVANQIPPSVLSVRAVMMQTQIPTIRFTPIGAVGVGADGKIDPDIWKRLIARETSPEVLAILNEQETGGANAGTQQGIAPPAAPGTASPATGTPPAPNGAVAAPQPATGVANPPAALPAPAAPVTPPPPPPVAPPKVTVSYKAIAAANATVIGAEGMAWVNHPQVTEDAVKQFLEANFPQLVAGAQTPAVAHQAPAISGNASPIEELQAKLAALGDMRIDG